MISTAITCCVNKYFDLVVFQQTPWTRWLGGVDCSEYGRHNPPVDFIVLGGVTFGGPRCANNLTSTGCTNNSRLRNDKMSVSCPIRLRFYVGMRSRFGCRWRVHLNLPKWEYRSIENTYDVTWHNKLSVLAHVIPRRARYPTRCMCCLVLAMDSNEQVFNQSMLIYGSKSLWPFPFILM